MSRTTAKPRVPCPPTLRPIPTDLCRLTDEQWEAWMRWESEAYTLAQLRRRQDILQSQLRTASKSVPRKDINNVLIHLDILAAAVSLQAFGDDDGWRVFKVTFDRLRREQ